MHSYTVTIGRNVGTTPVSEEAWLSFQGEVRHLLYGLRINTIDSVEQHMGIGYWDGISEESAKITLLTQDILPSFVVSHLANDLSDLAQKTGQDAISLTIGTSILCKPVKAGA